MSVAITADDDELGKDRYDDEFEAAEEPDETEAPFSFVCRTNSHDTPTDCLW